MKGGRFGGRSPWLAAAVFGAVLGFEWILLHGVAMAPLRASTLEREGQAREAARQLAEVRAAEERAEEFAAERSRLAAEAQRLAAHLPEELDLEAVLGDLTRRARARGLAVRRSEASPPRDLEFYSEARLVLDLEPARAGEIGDFATSVHRALPLLRITRLSLRIEGEERVSARMTVTAASYPAQESLETAPGALTGAASD